MGNVAESLDQAFAATGERLLAHLPQLFGALALILAGWLLARLLRLATRRATLLFDAMVERAGSLLMVFTASQCRCGRIGRSKTCAGRRVLPVKSGCGAVAVGLVIGRNSAEGDNGYSIDHVRCTRKTSRWFKSRS